MEGMLQVQNNTQKSFKGYFCVLDDEVFRIYNSNLVSLFIEIPLTKLKIHECSETDSSDYIFRFYTEVLSVVLKAPSYTDKYNWIEAMFDYQKSEKNT